MKDKKTYKKDEDEMKDPGDPQNTQRTYRIKDMMGIDYKNVIKSIKDSQDMMGK